GGMPMAGGWTMSMAWMRMPGQSWSAATAAFVAMWLLMMVAMMTPALVPMLCGYRANVRAHAAPRTGRLTAVAGTAHFAVRTALGAALYLPGIALAAGAMRWPALARAVPTASAALVAAAGALQLTAWKARCLVRCRAADCTHTAVPGPASVRAAFCEG